MTFLLPVTQEIIILALKLLGSSSKFLRIETIPYKRDLAY